MHTGRLSIKIQEVSLEQEVDYKVHCSVKIADYGHLDTPASKPTDFEGSGHELCFELGPITDPCHRHAQVMVYKSNEESSHGELLGQGQLQLNENLDDTPAVAKTCQLIDKTGKHTGHVKAQLRLFPCRSPGKVRDELGREHIDKNLLAAGQIGAPTIVNSQSPRHSKRETHKTL